MWLRWNNTPRGRLTAAASADDSDSDSVSVITTPRTPSRLQVAFSFKDVQSLLYDPNPPIPTRRASIFHRIRIASAALRTWKSLPAAGAAGGGAAADKRIVVYYTSLRVVRKTFEDCRAVVSILRGFRVAVDERDLSMDSGFLSELKGILGKKQLSLPRVFIGGRYIGGAEEVQQLHESGELKRIVEGYLRRRRGRARGAAGSGSCSAGAATGVISTTIPRRPRSGPATTATRTGLSGARTVVPIVSLLLRGAGGIVLPLSLGNFDLPLCSLDVRRKERRIPLTSRDVLYIECYASL